MPTILSLFLESLPLKDERLKRRASIIAQGVLKAQSCTISQICASLPSGADKATRRYLHNPNVDLKASRQVLYQTSFQNALQQNLSSLIVAYDPTYLVYGRHSNKPHQIRMGFTQSTGYRWQNAALIDPYSGRFLGVAHTTLVTAQGPDDTRYVHYGRGFKSKKTRNQLQRNLAHQFLVHALRVEAKAPKHFELIHVADMGFDDAFTLRGFRRAFKRSHFVIRTNDERILQVTPAGWIPAKPIKTSSQNWVPGSQKDGLVNLTMRDLLASIQYRNFGRIGLDARGRVYKGKGKPARYAKLELAAVPVRLAKKSERGQRLKVKEQAIWLNLVIVREKSPPSGKQSLQWCLLTDLPIDTLEQIERVVRSYLRRWRIEEFFRTCKEVLGLEKCQLKSPHALAQLLTFVVLKVMQLDEVRSEAGLKAGVKISGVQRDAIRKALERAKRIEKRVRNGGSAEWYSKQQGALMIIGLCCRYGGWEFKANSHLGNKILYRGLEILEAFASEGLYSWLLDDVSG